MAIACVVLLLTTTALVALEVLILAMLAYGLCWYAYRIIVAVVPSDPLAVVLAVIVAAVVVGLAWAYYRTARSAAADGATRERFRREKTRLLILASMAAVGLLADVLPIELTRSIRFAFVVLVGASFCWWLLTELDRSWPPDESDGVDERDGPEVEAIAGELGRQIGRLEARITPRIAWIGVATIGSSLAILAATAALLAPESERLLVGVSGLASLFVVGGHHGRVIRAERDSAAVLRELEEDLGPWTDESAIDEPNCEPALEERVRRLAAQADVPVPAVRLAAGRTPTAAAIGYRPATSTVVCSTRLLEVLDERELEAVLAHELAHVANRDAAVLTLLSFPGSAARATLERQARNPFLALPVHAVIAASRLCTAVVARKREYAADDGAVAITGDPAGLASALETLDSDLAARANRDLRGAAAAFSIVPPPWEERRFFDRPKRLVARRLLGMHPPTDRRIDRLERQVANPRAESEQ